MAGDDIQLQVGLDLDALKASAERGAGVLGQAFQNAMSSMMSGQTLGSGMPPTQAPGTGAAEAMLDALEGIQQTLQAGFSALIQGAGGGPSGGGGNGRAPTPAPGSGAPMETTPSPGGGYLTQSWNSGVGMASRFPQQAFATMHESGNYRTDVANFVHQSLSSIPILNQFSGVVANTFADADGALRDSTNVFRKGGNKSWGTFHDMMLNRGLDADGGGSDIAEARRLGLNRGDVAGITADIAGYGGSSRDSVRATMQMQGLYGLGNQASDVAGTFAKGGGMGAGGEQALFAEILAGAIASNLDRGRWGEAFTALAGAARRIQANGALDAGGMMATENFVNSMGGRFSGDGAAHQSMVGMMQGLQSGQGGGLAQVMALQAGGLGEDGYFAAQDRVNIGANAGGVGLAEVLQRYMKIGFVRRYMESGSDEDLNRAYILLSKMLPQFKPNDIKEMLRTMRKGMPKGTDPSLTRVMQRHMEGGKLPSKEADLASRDHSLQWSEYAIGDTRDSTTDVVENMDDARMQGAGRTGPAVEMVEGGGGPIAGYGAEGFGERRDSWPMGAGDKQEKGYKPGWRKGRANDPAHMGRDIVIGNGQPGERVHAPVAGIWLTATPARANNKAVSEGFMGEMLGDNAVRYKFVHLIFDAGLQKNMRIREGRFIGTVAAGSGGDWKPHLHLEARKKNASGKGSHQVDPNSTFDAHAREVLDGRDVGQIDSGPAPEFTSPDASSPGGHKSIAPENVVPLSLNSGGQKMEVIVRVFDSRISVARRGGRSGAPGQNFNTKKSV